MHHSATQCTTNYTGGVLIAVLRLQGVLYGVLFGDKVTKCAGQNKSSKQDDRKADFPGVTNPSWPDKRH